MRELVSILEELGCAEVKTYIQSGNVVLRSTKTATLLQDSVQDEIGKIKKFRVGVLALPISKFELAVKNCPFEANDGKHVHYFFTVTKPEPLNVEFLETLRTETEKYELIGSVFYLFAPDGIGRSKLANKIEKALGVPTTARNMNTINKLVELLQ